MNKFHEIQQAQQGSTFQGGPTSWRKIEPYAQAKETAAWLSTARDDDVTPLAEHVVLGCLRALQVIALSPYAKELTDMISRGYVDMPEPIVRLRRITALLEISKGEAP